MDIYIYGSEDFKKDIHELLEHSNIKFRLGENGHVIDLVTLDELKDAIEGNPNNIYIIDDSKIIKKNSLNNKIKFLKPKDGIAQEYLLDHGIGDVRVDSIDELSKHIKKRLDSVVNENESENIQESIVEIVEDAYENNDSSSEYIQLDDELKKLLTHKDDTEPKIEQIDDISSMLDEDLNENNEDKKDDTSSDEEDSNKYEDLFSQLGPEDYDDSYIEAASSNEDDESLDGDPEDIIRQLSFDEDFGNIDNNETKEETNIEEYTNQGDKMSNEFSELDSLNEADLLAALKGMDNESTVPPVVQKPSVSSDTEKVVDDKSLNLGSSSSEDIAKLISQLLNNKTLEITIKVKD